MKWYVDDTDVPVVRGSVVASRMFDEQGRVRGEVLRQVRGEQRRERRRRFKIRIRFRLFPKTQRRLEALENGRVALWSALKALELERDALCHEFHKTPSEIDKLRGDMRKLVDEVLFGREEVGK